MAESNNEPWTIGRLLNWTTGFLRDHGSESPRLDTEVLLAHALQCERIALYARFNDSPADAARESFRELVRRRSRGDAVLELARQRRPRLALAELRREAPEAPRRVDYLTAKQLADVLQISESTIHKLRRAGKIPAVMLTDRLIRFNLKDVKHALRPVQHSNSHPETARPPEIDPQLSFEDFFKAGE